MSLSKTKSQVVDLATENKKLRDALDALLEEVTIADLAGELSDAFTEETIKNARAALALQECKHIVSRGRDGELGSWCVRCGVKVLEVEWRACKHCIHFMESDKHFFPRCKKKGMSVLPDLHVTYKVGEGTCWEG